MKIIDAPEAMRAWSLDERRQGRTVGLVPTMGALHEGHASLLRACAGQNDAKVLSIFVNPAQFAPNEDYGAYPRTFEADVRLAEEMGMDAIYAPAAKTMYAEDHSTYLEVGGVSEGLCSATRPHFFRGVATVVAKLFNAVLPHRAYFGQKDAQQCAVIRRMARDLDMGVEIVELPIVRDSDGLALSSRNAYLDPGERARALGLSRSLRAAQALLESGERNAETIAKKVREGLGEADIDYIALVDAETMTPVVRIKAPILLALAVHVGKTRLIDNLKFAPHEAANGNGPENKQRNEAKAPCC